MARDGQGCAGAALRQGAAQPDVSLPLPGPAGESPSVRGAGRDALILSAPHPLMRRTRKGLSEMGNERVGWRDWCDRAPLSGTDFLALWRVCGRRDSRVDQVGDQYVEEGRPVLPFLAYGLAALIEVGHVTLGESGPASCAIRPLVVTASGRARYEDLCDRQGIAPYPVVVIDGTPQR